MANVEAGTVTVKVDADLDEFKKKVGQSVGMLELPEVKMIERPASELRLEALRLALQAHDMFGLDERVTRTAKKFADFVIDGTVAGE